MSAGSEQSRAAPTREFYESFPYPWPPMSMPSLEDPFFETVMLNQSIGDFSHRSIPADGRIWVAGCGTNQAVYTALRFPHCRVLGSDLSEASLDFSKRTAMALDIRNLELRAEDLNEAAYDAQFDYIISTGVVHHNREPARALATIAKALRRGGVLELMVYNQFHRRLNTSIQQAVRLITCEGDRVPTFEDELDVARALVDLVPGAGESAAYFRAAHRSEVADSLIQPVEASYTVSTLRDLARSCGLDLLLPCPNQFDKALGHLWSLAVPSPALQARIDGLPDASRWQLANLLKMEQSPMLWFYLRHESEVPSRGYEMTANESFLRHAFKPAATRVRNYFRNASELAYTAGKSMFPYPAPPIDPLMQKVLAQMDGERSMREVLADVGVDTTARDTISEIRLRSTTSVFPYLRAVARNGLYADPTQ